MAQPVEPAAAAPTPARSREAPRVCQMVWRGNVSTTGRVGSIAALGGWAVLVADDARFDLVSNREAPGAQPIEGADFWAYAARVGRMGGVVAGSGQLSLRLDRAAPSPALAFTSSSPAAVASGDIATVVAGPDPDGVVVLVFRGQEAQRVVVPAQGERAHVAVAVGATVVVGWLQGHTLMLATVDPTSGAVLVTASRAMQCQSCGSLSLTWVGTSVAAAVGSTIVHTGARANVVEFATWSPGGDIEAAQTEENRTDMRLGTVSGRPVGAWIESRRAIRFALMSDALVHDASPLTLTLEGARPESLVMSTSDEWAWLSWIDGDRRAAMAVRCGPSLEPVRSDFDVPPGCDGPEDCEGRRCVTAAMGGDYGCSNETCCGADECGNGCRNDADCPPCRPRCVVQDGRTHGSCQDEAP